MKSGERVGKTGEATGWESVAAEAGKFNDDYGPVESLDAVDRVRREVKMETAREQALKAARDREVDEEIEAERVTDKREFQVHERAQEYSENCGKETCYRIVIGEVRQLNMLEDKLFHLKRGSLFYNRRKNKLKAEIKRYGDDFPTMIDGLTDELYYRRVEEIGRKRAYNWSILDSAMKGENAKENMKRLKKKGFSKLPKWWGSTDFTSEEISRMSSIVKP